MITIPKTIIALVPTASSGSTCIAAGWPAEGLPRAAKAGLEVTRKMD
jgi:hypothetical protein